MKQKGFASILILFSVFLLILLGVFLFYKKTDVNKTQTTNNTVLTKNKKWEGAILEKDNIIKIDENGRFISREKLPSLTLKEEKDFVTLWSKGMISLKGDGLITLIGIPTLSPEFKQDTIYGWKVGEKDGFKPIFTLTNGQKIASYIFSPDSKQIALISVSRFEEELYETSEYTGLKDQEISKEVRKRQNQYQNELEIISIYDTETKKLINTLKIRDQSDFYGPSIPVLRWIGKNLLAIETSQVTVLNPQTGEVIGNIESDHQIIDGRFNTPTFVFSPDGTKYFNPQTAKVKSIPGDNLIATLEAPPEARSLDRVSETNSEYIGYTSLSQAAFSRDSNVLFVVGESMDNEYFLIWQHDLLNNKVLKIADFFNLNFGSSNEWTRISNTLKKTLHFLSVNPTSQKIIFGLFTGDENPDHNRADYFVYPIVPPASQASEYHEELPLLKNFLGRWEFLGWYLN